MHTLLIASTLALLASCGGEPAGDTMLNAETVDTAGISELWATVDRTWQGRDPDAFLRLFSEDASFALVDRGLWLEGQDEIHAHFTSQFGAQRAELRHATEIGAMRLVASGAVALDGTVRILDGPADDTPPVVLRTLSITAVMTRTGPDWRILIVRAHTLSD